MQSDTLATTACVHSLRLSTAAGSSVQPWLTGPRTLVFFWSRPLSASHLGAVNPPPSALITPETLAFPFLGFPFQSCYKSALNAVLDPQPGRRVWCPAMDPPLPSGPPGPRTVPRIARAGAQVCHILASLCSPRSSSCMGEARGPGTLSAFLCSFAIVSLGSVQAVALGIQELNSKLFHKQRL